MNYFPDAYNYLINSFFFFLFQGSYLTSVGISDQKTALLHSLLAGSALVGRVSVLFVHLLPFSILLTYPIIAVISCGVSVVVLLVTPHWIFYIYSICKLIMMVMIIR